MFTPDILETLRRRFADAAGQSLRDASGIDAETDSSGVTMGAGSAEMEYGTPDQEAVPFVHSALRRVGR